MFAAHTAIVSLGLYFFLQKYSVAVNRTLKSSYLLILLILFLFLFFCFVLVVVVVLGFGVVVFR